jgi:hypothetical protein
MTTDRKIARLLVDALKAMRQRDATMADAYIGAAEVGNPKGRAAVAVAAVRAAYRHLDACYAADAAADDEYQYARKYL